MIENNVKKLVMFIGLIVAMYLIFSCSKLKEGHVTKKWYEPYLVNAYLTVEQ